MPKLKISDLHEMLSSFRKKGWNYEAKQDENDAKKLAVSDFVKGRGLMLMKACGNTFKCVFLEFLENGEIRLVDNSIKKVVHKCYALFRPNIPRVWHTSFSMSDMEGFVALAGDSGLIDLLDNKRPFGLNYAYKGGLTDDERTEKLDLMYE